MKRTSVETGISKDEAMHVREITSAYKFLALLFTLLIFCHPNAFSQSGAWSTEAPMPTARQVMGVGVVNGKVYAVGGTNSVTSSGTDFSVVEAYDPVSNRWSTQAPIPTPRHSFGVGVINGVPYAVGGYSFNCFCVLSTVEAYDPVSNTWSTKAPMPTPRSDLTVGVVNGVLYAVGGFNGNYLSTVEAYDPASNTWSTKASMPTARQGLAAGVVDGILYVVGGSSNSGILSTLEAYDPVSNTWSTKASMPTARYLLAAGVVNEMLYALGGHNGANVVSTVEAYDPASDSWSTQAPMPTARIPAAGVVNGVLYAVGGYDYHAGTALSTNEAFTPTSPGVAQLSGGNTFTGNQTVNGNVAASFFVGDGSALTNLNPANLASGTAAINISGTAASAVNAINAVNATNAGNASNLGGVAAGNYARLDTGNSFTGNQSVTGNVSASGNLSTAGTTTMGGGTPIVEHLSQTPTITVPAIVPNQCATLSLVTFSGASDGDTIALGVKNALTSGGNLTYFGWVSAANKITIKVCNPHGTTNSVLSGTIRVDIWKH